MTLRVFASTITCAMFFLLLCTGNPSTPDPTIADSYEPDDTRELAGTIYPDSGSQIRTLKRGDIDWVSFTASAGRTYTIFTFGTTDTRIQVFTSASTTPVLDGDDSPNNVNARVEFDCSMTTRCFVSIFGSDESITGPYEFAVESSVGPDLFEPDSLPEHAASIAPGALQNRSLTAGEGDWIRFSVTSDDTVRLIATGDCRIAMTLYDRDTLKTLLNAIVGDSVTDFTYRVLAAGTYFVKISAWGRQTGSYTLTMQTSSSGTLVNDDQFENDDTRGSAGLLPGGTVLQKRSFTPGDTDWVALPVVVGRQYTLTTSGSSVGAIMYTRSGTVLQGPASSLVLNSSATDTVLVKLYPTVATALNYTLLVSVMWQSGVADGFEPDNSRKQAKFAPSDSFLQDRTLTFIDSVNDTDWVAFPAKNGWEYSIVAGTLTSSTMRMYLYDDQSTGLLRYSTDGSKTLTYTPAVSDTLYLMLCLPPGSGSLAYTLSVSGKLYNDSYEPDSSRATAHTLGAQPQSRMLLPGDTDWVAYTVESGDSVVVVTTGNTDTKLALFTSSGSAPVKESDDIGGSNRNAQVSWNSIAGGQFYIRVTAKTSLMYGQYVLQVMSVLSGTLAPMDIFEVDDSKKTARIITDTILEGQRHSLHLGDTDWVALPAVAGGQYTVTVDSSSGEIDVYGYTAADSVFGSRTRIASGTLIYSAEKADTLYYKVTSPATVARYNISMRRTLPPPADSYEKDNSKAQARIVTDTLLVNEAHTLSFRDTDWVAFPVVAGASYTFGLTGGSSSFEVQLVDAGDSLITSRAAATSATLLYTPQADDTLYLRVSSPVTVQQYTVSMSRTLPLPPDKFENDNSKARARIIIDTVLVSELHSISFRDTDWVAFPMVAGGQYTVTFGSTPDYINVLAVTSGDSVVFSRTGLTNDGIRYVSPKDDTLYFRFSAAAMVPYYSVSMRRVLPIYPDRYENDNSQAQARLITDSVLSGEVHSLTTGDTDWIALPAVAGGTYTVTINSTSNLHLYGYIAQGTFFDSDQGSVDVAVTRASWANETVYFRVTCYDTVRSYTISMSRIPPPAPDSYENDNNRDQAKPIVQKVPQVHTLAMNDSDWVKIIPEEGSVYRVSSTASFRHIFALFTGSYPYPIDTGIGMLNTHDFVANRADTLYVLVRQVETDVSLQGTYTLNVAPLAEEPVIAFAAGATYTLAIKADGTLWGAGENSSGQLGQGSIGSTFVPVKIMNDVASVSAGGGHTLIVKKDGTLWATGWNAEGQLGDGTTTARSSPVRVMNGVAAASGGGNFSLVLKTDGTVWATGSNNWGQLGDGTTTSRSTPIQVMTDVAAVSAGSEHSLFLKKDGTLLAAGYNIFGQLGTGTTTSPVRPVVVMTNVAAACGGVSHSMLLKNDGTLWGTGDNTKGQLGRGSAGSFLNFVQIMTNVAYVSCGFDYTLIVKRDSTLWVTGDNGAGQLGIENTPQILTPVQTLTDIISVSAARGGFSLVLRKNSGLWGMGINSYGQLGDGTTTERQTPVRVYFQQAQ